MKIEVLLPLPVAGLFSYNIPTTIETPNAASLLGYRVLVPFGKKKIYTGIIWGQKIKDEGQRTEDGIKDILSFLDSSPLMSPLQMRLWEWIAQYYMCTLGEVMRAAFPGALKLEGDNTQDQIADKYRPKTERWIRLAHTCTETEQQLLIKSLSRAKQQQRLLLLFLGEGQEAVHMQTFLAQTGFSYAILKQLVDKHILAIEERQIGRLSAVEIEGSALPTLSAAQTIALAQIQQQWESKAVTLLHGVTSSGKTEIYMHLIEQTLQQGRQVLYLVPEIALTTQLTDRLRAVFGDKLGVYHSRFSDNERVEIYRDFIGKNRYQIILGARSAVLLPFCDLGLVIVDEEHDASYKQQEPAPRYHARNAAIMLAHLAGAKTLLGTATPSIESYYNAEADKYGLVSLTERFAGLQLPTITLVNLQEQYRRKEMTGHFSDVLTEHIRQTLAKGKQTIVFQNRRGSASYVECKHCGFVPKCVNCDVSMTAHERQGILSCHYCGYTMPIPAVCPSCNQPLRERGFGTEKVEDELQTLFPEAKVARMDADTTRNKNSYQHIIRQFAAHKVDILVGTQMVTKGLHFDDVQTVAVLNADNLMNKPDFRAYEQAYQMLEQVSGRAGRKGEEGEVIIQTFDPKNPILQLVKQHDYKGFYTHQIAERKRFVYPPFCRLLEVHLRMRDSHLVDVLSNRLLAQLKAVFGNRCAPRIIVPNISRVRNEYLRSIILKIEPQASYQQAKDLLHAQIDWLRTTPDGKAAQIYVDIDPM